MYLDLHILHTVPPSNVNRDDTGNPKTAIYGGVRRARVSSQAWKRATRAVYKDHLDTSDLGVRTKRAVELLTARIEERAPELAGEEAQRRAGLVLTALGIKLEAVKTKTRVKADEAGEDRGREFETTQYLIFWSNRQLDRLAELAVSSAEKPTKKAAMEAADEEHGIDVALFGRMVADAADINVDASVQVAHALSTHAVEIEQDYFTAVDETNPDTETGAGMIGTVDFDSATLYRYATINVAGLRDNLGDDEATLRAIGAFVKAFAISMPTGKQNTFANRTVPDAVVAVLREDQPINLVGAYEEPVAADESHVQRSSVRLASYARSVDECVGRSAAVFVTRSTPHAAALDDLGDRGSLDDVVTSSVEAVRSRLDRQR